MHCIRPGAGKESTVQIQNAVAFVTGANRGLGRAIAEALLARGARKVYAGVRQPERLDLPGVEPVRLDVTDPAAAAAAAAQCGDVNLLVNNAGIARVIGFLDAQAADATREIFETNLYGLIHMSQAFAPVLAANGGGAIANVLSVASWINAGRLSVYAASKSAAWGFTNGLRNELRGQGTQVVGLHVGFIDTDLTKGFDVPKVDARDVAAQLLDGIAEGQEEVLADDITRAVKQGLSQQPGIYLDPPQR